MALVLDGINQRATGIFTATRDLSLGASVAVVFKTGAVVTGVRQTIASINVASGNFRGLSLIIRADGYFSTVINSAGSDSEGSAPFLNVVASPNTIYKIVLVRTTTHVISYIDTIPARQTRATGLASVAARMHLGSALTSSTWYEPFGGKIVRAAFWPSILSAGDINICLDSLQTPANCSVLPQDYWQAVSNDLPTIGANSLTRFNSATYDTDTLSSPVISSITDPIEVGGSLSFTGGNWVNGSFTSIATDVTGATVSSITGNTTSGAAVIAGWVDGSAYDEVPCPINLTFNDGSGTFEIESTLQANSAYTKVAVDTPNTATAGYLAADILTQTGRTIATGDSFYHTVPAGMPDLVIEPDTWYSVTNEGTFELWLWVSSGADAGKMFQYTVTITESGAVVVDTTPDDFTLTDVTGAAASTVYESNVITVTGVMSGVNIATSISGSGGTNHQYAVSTDGGTTYGDYTSSPTNVQLNYKIKVRLTSNATTSHGGGETASATLTVGGVSDTFTVTNAGVNTNPVVNSVLITELSGQIDASDGEGDTLTYTLTTDGAYGSAVVNSSSGAFTYTPDVSFTGNDSFVVTITDGYSGTTVVTVSIVDTLSGGYSIRLGVGYGIGIGF